MTEFSDVILHKNKVYAFYTYENHLKKSKMVKYNLKLFSFQQSKFDKSTININKGFLLFKEFSTNEDRKLFIANYRSNFEKKEMEKENKKLNKKVNYLIFRKSLKVGQFLIAKDMKSKTFKSIWKIVHTTPAREMITLQLISLKEEDLSNIHDESFNCSLEHEFCIKKKKRVLSSNLRLDKKTILEILN